MKKAFAILACAALFTAPLPLTYAEEAPQQAAAGDAAPAMERAVDPALTNRQADYPGHQAMAPSAPVPPAGGLSDVQAFLTYGQQVEAYIKALQTYIDGATNDANDILAKRNAAVEAANAAVEQYNSFIHSQKK